MGGPLAGVLVVSLEQAVAAPLATARLADAGARVIKVERPGGEFARGYDTVAKGQSAYFVWLNRGKESIELDYKDPGDAALLARIIARADVFVQNLVPGATERAGFGSAGLRRAHPRLVTCDISGYGDAGPYRDMKAYDLLVQAESGLASVTGSPDAPGRVGVSVCDIATGTNAFGGIVTALYERERTGRGGGVKLSLFATLAEWMTVPLLYHELAGAAPARIGMHHPSIAPYGAYDTAGGEQVVLGIQNEREWRRFCDAVLERPELAADPRFADNPARVRNRAELDLAIAAVLCGLPRAAAMDRLRAAGIAFGAVNSVADLSGHAQLRRIAVDTPQGEVALVAPPVGSADGDERFGPVPGVGEHGAAIRAEFAE